MAMVLVHGGGFAGSCWDRMVPHLTESPVVAVDLPGRGAHPADLSALTIADFVEAVVTEVEALGDDVLLVGHSLAGVTLPGVMARAGDHLRRVVFVSCTVPAHGTSVVSALRGNDAPGVDWSELDDARPALSDDADLVLDADVARLLFCNDMDHETTDYTLSLQVPEAPGVIVERADMSGLDRPVPKTWVRLTDDAILSPALQDESVGRMGGAEVIDLHAGHMAMISRPAELAALLNVR